MDPMRTMPFTKKDKSRQKCSGQEGTDLYQRLKIQDHLQQFGGYSPKTRSNGGQASLQVLYHGELSAITGLGLSGLVFVEHVKEHRHGQGSKRMDERRRHLRYRN